MSTAEEQKIIAEHEESAINIVSSEMQSFINSIQRSKRKRDSSKMDIDKILNLRADFDAIRESIKILSQQNPGDVPNEITENYLPLIAQEIEKQIRDLDILWQNAKASREIISTLGEDAGGDSKVEIADIKYRDEQWCIKVTCSENCTKNFRNVDIWETETNNKVASFLLIEPGVTIKYFLQEKLVPMNHLVATINNRIVSNPKLIEQAKIIGVEYVNEDIYSIIIENLSKNPLSGFNIIDSQFNCLATPNIEILGYSKETVNLQAELVDKMRIYIEQNDIILSCHFEVLFATEDEENNVNNNENKAKDHVDVPPPINNAPPIANLPPSINTAPPIHSVNIGPPPTNAHPMPPFNNIALPTNNPPPPINKASSIPPLNNIPPPIPTLNYMPPPINNAPPPINNAPPPINNAPPPIAPFNINLPPANTITWESQLSQLSTDNKKEIARWFKDNYQNIPDEEIINAVKIDTTDNWKNIVNFLNQKGFDIRI